MVRGDPARAARPAKSQVCGCSEEVRERSDCDCNGARTLCSQTGAEGCLTGVQPLGQVAMLFWDDRKVEKARAWLNRAITLNTDYGRA